MQAHSTRTTKKGIKPSFSVAAYFISFRCWSALCLIEALCVLAWKKISFRNFADEWPMRGQFSSMNYHFRPHLVHRGGEQEIYAYIILSYHKASTWDYSKAIFHHFYSLAPLCANKYYKMIKNFWSSFFIGADLPISLAERTLSPTHTNTPTQNCNKRRRRLCASCEERMYRRQKRRIIIVSLTGRHMADAANICFYPRFRYRWLTLVKPLFLIWDYFVCWLYFLRILFLLGTNSTVEWNISHRVSDVFNLDFALFWLLSSKFISLPWCIAQERPNISTKLIFDLCGDNENGKNLAPESETETKIRRRKILYWR